MPHHALEITLTRPATPGELERANRLMPLGANHDHTRLTALPQAKTPRRALTRLRHAFDDVLPVDIITTHYPDVHGKITLNVAFTPAANAAVHRAAAAYSQDIEEFVEQAVTDALARTDRQQTERLNQAVQALLAATTRERLLTAVAHALTTQETHP
ncbi:hypothetical protein [Streptomyces sp. NPDC002133]|uniref:hypothetical protein n=1 Tax=Streptomyces sp. NPDC002133 TaxID=3154409 RepID=UPI003326B546